MLKEISKRLRPLGCRTTIAAAWGCFVLALAGCSDRQESAHASLGARNFDFSVEDFLRAAREGNMDTVRQFLTAGMDPAAADADGTTALHLAAENGHGHLVRELASRGAPVDAVREDGCTPLHLAARQGDVESLTVLLESGADTELRSGRGLPALAEAALSGNAAGVNILAEKSPKALDYCLQLAAVKGNTEVMDVLLRHGASPLARSSENRTPLMYAAAYGRMDAARLLCERGASRLAIDNDLKTAGMLAADAGHTGVAHYLNEPEPEPAAAASASAEILPADSAAAPRSFGAVIEAAAGGTAAASPTPAPAMRPIHGANLAARVESPPISGPAARNRGGASAATGADVSSSPTPRLHFRQFHERQLPVLLESVSADEKSVHIRRLDGAADRIAVEVGKDIPGSGLKVVSARQKWIHSKGGKGRLVDVSSAIIRDEATGESMLAVRSHPVTSGRPIAIVAADGEELLFEARVGDVFTAGGRSYKIADVRPTQILLEDTASRETHVLER